MPLVFEIALGIVLSVVLLIAGHWLIIFMAWLFWEYRPTARAKVFWGVVAASTLMVLEMCALRENIDRRGRLQKTTGCVHLARGPDRLSFGYGPTL